MQFLPTEIDRLEWSTLRPRQFEREYSLRLRPAIVSGAIDHWSARTKWTPGYFRERYASLVVSVDGRNWRLGELIDEILSSTPQRPAAYLRNQLLADLPSELLVDVSPMPECTQPNWLESRAIPASKPLTYVELYIGGAGAVFPILHYDNLHTHAFLMQIYGEKEYLVLAPDQGRLLYPEDGASNNSRIGDLDHPDLERFPLFDQARGIRFRLRPGETLFVPAGWWHTARILSTSITVSVNAANRANWSAFREDYVRGRTSRWRAELLKSYLFGLGVLFRLKRL